MKKIMSFVLCLALIISSLVTMPKTANAAGLLVEIVDGITWKGTESNGYATDVTIGGGTVSETIRIPNTIQGCPIYSLSGNFFKSVIPRSSTTIDATSCSSLSLVNASMFSLNTPITFCCNNPNVKITGGDTTSSYFQYKGPSYSYAKGFFAGKYIENGVTASFITFASGAGVDFGTPYQMPEDMYIYTGSSALTYGSTIKLSSIPIWNYHTFEGFYYGDKQIFDATGNFVINEAYTLSDEASYVLTARWRANSLSICYHDSGYTNGIKEESMTFGSPYTVIASPPAKVGYTFCGWATMPNGSVVYNSTNNRITPTENIHLYSVWAENTYAVTYYPNGGSGAETKKTYSYTDLIKMTTLPGSEIGAGVNQGYIFSGWSFDAAGTRKITMGKDIVAYGSNNIPLYAVWTKGSYTVHYTYGSRATDTFSYDAYVTLPNVEKIGYNFLGWSKTSNGNVDYPKDMPAMNIATVNQLDVYLYPVFAPITYTIQFKAYDSMDSGMMSDLTVTYGTTTDFPSCGYQRTGYKFLGWSYDRVAPVSNQNPSVNFSDGQKGVENTLSTTDKAVITLYPVWAAGVYTISYDTNAGKDTVVWPGKDYKTSYVYGDYYKLPSITRVGYHFLGWIDENGNHIEEITNKDKRDFKLKATWKEVGCQILFDDKYVTSAQVNGKTILLNNVLTDDNDFEKGTSLGTLTLTLTEAVDYKGVSVLSSTGVIAQTGTLNGRTLTVELNGYSITDTIHVAITGEARKFNITYDLDGGQIKGDYPTQYTYGKALTLPTNVEKASQKFAGWRIEGDGHIIKELPDSQIGDVKLIAIWANGSYSATVDLCGGSTKDERFNGKNTWTLDYQFNSGNIELPGDVTREGFDFLGWYDYSTQSYVSYIQTGQPTDHIIYAMYSQNTGVGFVSTVISNAEYTEIKVLSEKDDANGYYYYDLLTEVEKRIYTTVFSAYRYDEQSGKVNGSCLKISSPVPFSHNDALNALAALCKDHPEIFWIRFFDASSSENDGKDNYIAKDGMYETIIVPHLAYQKEVIAADVLEFDANLSDTIFNLRSLDIEKMNDAEKVKLVNKYIAEEFSYNSESKILNATSSNETRSVGYFLSHKSGCCEAYAKLTMLLLRAFGVESITVTSNDHMWNEVRLGDKWFAQDTTWNDDNNSNKVLDDYLLVGKSKVSDAHHEVSNHFFMEANIDKSGVAEQKPVTTYGCFMAPEISNGDYGVITKSNITYRISGKKAVLTKVSGNKKNYSIKASVTIDGKKYTITEIAASAFKNKKTMKRLWIGSTKITKIGTAAFKNTNKKLIIKADGSKSYKKKLTKMIKKAGAYKKVKVK